MYDVASGRRDRMNWIAAMRCFCFEANFSKCHSRLPSVPLLTAGALLPEDFVDRAYVRPFAAIQFPSHDDPVRPNAQRLLDPRLNM